MELKDKRILRRVLVVSTLLVFLIAAGPALAGV